MDDPAIIATWAAVIAAIFGPLIGVGLASALARQDARRTEAAGIFRRTMEDAQNYRHAFLNTYWLELEMTDKFDELTCLESLLGKTLSAMTNPSKLKMEDTQSAIDALSNNLRRIDGKHAQAFNETRSLQTLLSTDKMSLGLLFDTKSEKCGRAIERLIETFEVFDMENRPCRDDCQVLLNECIRAISDEMKPLYESLRHLDPSI